ncbi:MAG TPA: hypothetical protein VLI54_06390 [Bacillota bacterium]|nr:hypothetical protein [Bacillota bacterium]
MIEQAGGEDLRFVPYALLSPNDQATAREEVAYLVREAIVTHPLVRGEILTNMPKSSVVTAVPLSGFVELSQRPPAS